MKGVDVSDIHRNFTSDEWDKLGVVGGNTYIYQRRDYLVNNRGSGCSDGRGSGGRGGGRGYERGGSYTGRSGRSQANDPRQNEQHRAIAVAGASNSTEIVEYDGDNGSNVSS